MEDRRVTVIIPAYNEETSVARTLAALVPLARERGWEVIVIDDGSSDGTGEVAERSGARVVRHPENRGYGAALKSGIRAAANDTIVMMDSDGQHDPSRIDSLLEPMDSYDMVVGARRRMRGIRTPGKMLLALVANYLAGEKIPDINSGFRAFRRSTIKEFLHFCPNGFSFTTTITLAYLRGGYSVKHLPLDVEHRSDRASTVRLFRDGYKTFLLVIRVIVLFNPLKVFMPASLVLFLGGVAFIIAGIVRFHRAPNLGVLAVMSSVVIFFMGVMADQISAIRRERRLD